ncbi:hypothetical protein CSB37_03320 [bacterium DOLZORAL124_38_8]|nr:MAG: hypothetical protein CSB37_03320 [bacterium DOLZORAL124_38_8]
MIERTCRVSGEKFEITKGDLEFYAKIGMIAEENLQDLISGKINDCSGLPTLCPEERQRRRLAWRNERSICMRTCDATGRTMMSTFSQEVSFPVYSYEYWWSNNWDALDYGQEFDFSRPFFEQFFELMENVPVPSRAMEESTCINSEYCNEASRIKNCYLCFEFTESEDCMYSRGCQNCRDVSDCLNCTYAEMAYGLVESHNCSYSKYLFDCKNCNDCEFCANCIGCHNCFGSVNLRNKEYYFMNKKYTQSEYENKVSSLKSKYKESELLTNFLQHKTKFPTKFAHNLNTENCTGEYLNNCKNSYCCFSCGDLEDCKYCDGLLGGVRNFSSMDVSHFGLGVQHCYESQCIGGAPGTAFQVLFSTSSWNVRDLFYCYFCIQGSASCFGCIGLRKKQYCILNKQYTKEAYEKLLPKIIEHMKQTGEWGEFFPANMSPFAYNETVANEYFSLTKDEAEKRGYQWKEEPINKKYETLKQSFDWNQISDDIQEVGDDILTKVLFCERSGKPYQIQKAELKFYRKMNLPIPHLHPDERYKMLMRVRSGRTLLPQSCHKCGESFLSVKNKNDFVEILCEKCYLEAVN